ncbi:16S ribosomal RNA methyltransferase KsgA/Dim1 family protein [Rosistilla oblonga]|uniref:class I SAM-dependent methyltransferase n=1 Tax=Rosistilla oblonga TaxID=2527990 RepID=UPI00118D5220|nr:methyltransferase domain-containing protein [Rosistilla oblonga]QDV13973.1 16S ribosomal RNA methyltransferase KsgA/Dim1 family protein [Rosistilla oblonga]
MTASVVTDNESGESSAVAEEAMGSYHFGSSCEARPLDDSPPFFKQRTDLLGNNSLQFVKSFLRQPGAVGAIAPSSEQLAQTMVGWFDWESARGVVEYGPGTGVFTKHVVQKLHPDAKFFAIERDPELVAIVQQKLPDVDVVEESVANVVALCQARGIEQVDAIVCGLPWASFPDTLQRECIDAMMQVLRPGGQFATFAYWQGLLLPAGQRFKRRLGDYFSTVEYSPTVWRNLPPAFVYRCTR